MLVNASTQSMIRLEAFMSISSQATSVSTESLRDSSADPWTGHGRSMELRQRAAGWSGGKSGASEWFQTFSSSRDSGAWSRRAEKNVPGANTFAAPSS